VEQQHLLRPSKHIMTINLDQIEICDLGNFEDNPTIYKYSDIVKIRPLAEKETDFLLEYGRKDKLYFSTTKRKELMTDYFKALD